MGKTVIEQYNGLHNRTVTRKHLQKVLTRAKKAKELRVIKKLESLLSKNDDEKFFINIENKLTKRRSRKIAVKRNKAANKSKSSVTKNKSAAPKKDKKVKVVGLGMPKVYVSESTNVPTVLPADQSTMVETIQNQRVSLLPEIKKTVLSEKPQPQIKKVNPKEIKKAPKGVTTMADLDSTPVPSETFKINTEIGKFLGDLEKKPVHSVVVTLDAPAGSGKTRFFFQVMEDFASYGHTCAFITLEEHSTSKLFKNKRDQYINPSNYSRVSVIDDISCYQDFKKIVETHEVILTDSFGKLQKLIKEFKIEIDDHVRKAFDSKLFFFIFQRTTAKTMRGGADSEFDADVILQVEKPTDDYRDNYVISRKNRYNELPDCKYSIYHKKIIEGDFDDIEKPTKNSVTPTDSSTKLVVSSF